MDIIQQIARKMVEEICTTIQKNGLNDIEKTIKALQPVVSGTVLDNAVIWTGVEMKIVIQPNW